MFTRIVNTSDNYQIGDIFVFEGREWIIRDMDIVGELTRIYIEIE
jgi:hypothetical protein